MRTITSLLCLGWLAAGPATAEPPPPLRPLAPPPDLRDPPAALVPAVKPAGVPGPQTLYFQKDAQLPALPMPRVAPGVRPADFQEPQQPPAGRPPEVPPATDTASTEAISQLFSRALQTRPPAVADIGLKTGADVMREVIRDVDQIVPQQRATFGTFPTDYQPLTEAPYSPRTFPPMAERVEPALVCYRRLYFEEKNAERYGWEAGPLQPILSTLYFYKDMLFLPYHIGTRPCQRYECSAGYCLPGDPVPYILYPPELSATGVLLETATVGGLVAIFP